MQITISIMKNWVDIKSDNHILMWINQYHHNWNGSEQRQLYVIQKDQKVAEIKINTKLNLCPIRGTQTEVRKHVQKRHGVWHS